MRKGRLAAAAVMLVVVLIGYYSKRRGGSDRDAAAQALVDEVGARLVRSGPAKDSPYKFEFTLLADDKTVNALALPGGPIFITRALYERLSTEAELAGVLGHEVGHVLGRHAAERLAKSQLGQLAAQAVVRGGRARKPHAGPGAVVRARARRLACAGLTATSRPPPHFRYAGTGPRGS